MTDPRTDIQDQRQPGGWLLQDVSNALVALHKEQFGRRPTRVQSHFAGPDALLCVMDDALLPAEREMVDMGEQRRVREARLFFQIATAAQFIETVESITGRTVRAFASASDPDRSVVMENFVFEPDQATTVSRAQRPHSPTAETRSPIPASPRPFRRRSTEGARGCVSRSGSDPRPLATR